MIGGSAVGSERPTTCVALEPLLRAISRGRAALEQALPRSLTVVDLGCGRKKLAGAIGVDARAHEGVDVVLDLESQPLPFEDASVDIVHSDQFLEHVAGLIPLVREVLRVLRPGGLMIARVPYFRSSFAYLDPTHVRFFGLCTMDYFVQGTDLYRNYRFFDEGFREVHRVLQYDATGLKSLFMRALRRAASRDPHGFENSPFSAAFPFTNVTFCLVK